MNRLKSVRLTFYLGAFLFSLLILTWMALARIEKQTLSAIGESLQTVLNTTEEALLLWQSHQTSFMSDVASDPALIKATQKLLATDRNPSVLLADQAQNDIRSLFQIQFDRGTIKGIFVIAPDSVNRVSMRDGDVGMINLIALQRGDLFNKTLNGATVIVPPIRSDISLQNSQGQMKDGFPTMFAMAPIIEGSGSIIAVLAIRYDPFEHFTRITQLGRIGETGETYAFDQNGLLVTTSRFDEQLLRIGMIKPGESGMTVIRIVDPGRNLLTGGQPEFKSADQPFTIMAQSAIAGEKSFNVDGYRDYRGVTVVGAWLWSTQLGFGLTTEIDKNEALLPYYKTRTAISWFVSVTLGLAIALTIMGTVMRRRRERGMLEYQDQLEQLIDERTSEIRAQNAMLVKAQSEIKQLSGLLPICSHCKNIRDEEGEWSKIESYIHDHSEADFTHGVCPDCIRIHYPEIKYEHSE